jgi:hypothetical protein
VLDVPSGGHHNASWRVMLIEVALDPPATEVVDGLGKPEDRATERVRTVDCRLKPVEDEVLWGVLVHLHLLDDNLLLLLDLFLGEGRSEDKVENYVKGPPEVLVEAASVVARVLLRGERIEVPPDGLHPLRDVVGAAADRPLEHHVLDEVGEPGLLGGLVPAPRLHPCSHGNRANGGDALRNHADPIR